MVDIIAMIPGQTSLADAERLLIERTMAVCGSKVEAAAALGVSVRTLYTKLKDYEVKGRSRRAS